MPDEEVIELYGGTQHIPLYQMSGFYGKGPSIKQFMDIFSLPEMALLSCVVDHFLGHGLEFDQVHLYKDVTDAIWDVHVKGLMYQWIARDMEKYILRGDETFTVLSRLVAHGKQLFLITNSPFSFVDKGMSFPFFCLPFSLLPHSRELNLSPWRPGVFCYRLEVAL